MSKFGTRIESLRQNFKNQDFTYNDAKQVLTKNEKISDCNINRGVIERAVKLGILIYIAVNTYRFKK